MKKLPTRNIWKVILTSRGKMIKSLAYGPTEENIYEKFRKEKDRSDSVRFPVRVINVGKLVDADYEIYLIKKKEDDDDITRVRDKDGTIRPFRTDDDNWVIIDRESYNIEETFWVYGYHPVYQRKDFKWIYENLLTGGNKKNTMLQVAAYNNKLMVSGGGQMQMVMCKNVQDCVRLYNELEKECKKDKKKYILFIGDVFHSNVKKFWKGKIKELTNWSDKKIMRNSLRP